MKLSNAGLKSAGEWKKHGFELPQYDREKVVEATKKNPTWIHFGAGNIFRAFLAAAQETLLNKKLTDKGIITGSGHDFEVVEKVYKPFDNLTLLVVLKANGQIEKKVIGSVAAAHKCDPSFPEEWDAFKTYFKNPSLQMASFTITEKGYNIKDNRGNFVSAAETDIKNGPEKPALVVSKVAALLFERYKAGKHPIALISMDNCAHNGEKLHDAVFAIAREWQKKGFVPQDFCAYLNNEKLVTFPWSMIDKITPRPSENVMNMLKKDGFEDAELIRTSKDSFIAPFVNAEESEYLVIEDKFPNGRPPLEQAGIYITDRETVNKVEKMKVCTCLNPLHTALAIFGCLLNYKFIFEEMKNPVLKRLVEDIAFKEGMPVVVDPKIIDPKQFITQVLQVRLPNPFMPDTPQRISCDTSQKLPVRFGETIKAYIRDNRNLGDLKLIPLVFAGWCRYLMGIDDEGNPMELNPDPLLPQVTKYAAGIKLGDKPPFTAKLKPLLSDAKIFGIDLYQTELAQKVESYFAEMVAKKGAVKETLDKVVGIK